MPSMVGDAGFGARDTVKGMVPGHICIVQNCFAEARFAETLVQVFCAEVFCAKVRLEVGLTQGFQGGCSQGGCLQNGRFQSGVQGS